MCLRYLQRQDSSETLPNNLCNIYVREIKLFHVVCPNFIRVHYLHTTIKVCHNTPEATNTKRTHSKVMQPNSFRAPIVILHLRCAQWWNYENKLI